MGGVYSVEHGAIQKLRSYEDTKLRNFTIPHPHNLDFKLSAIRYPLQAL